MNRLYQIINYLGKNIKKGFTMHELSRILNIPYASFYRAVQQMKNLLSIEHVGKSKVIKLNVNNPVVKAHLTVASDEERKEFLKSQPLIRKICNELKTKDIVVLFGSYAKGKQNEKSDIDILVVNNDGKKSLSFSKYELLFKKKINPIFISKREFKEMLRDRDENIGKQVLKGHIVLNAIEDFWRCVLSGV